MTNQIIKNKDHLNTNTAKIQQGELQTKQPTLSESAAKLLLDQMRKMSGSSSVDETLAMVACAKAIADLIRANADAKRI